MKVERIKVADLHADPANVRRHPGRNLDAIRASLARFGQQRPVLVDANNVVRAGNATLEAARALGWDAVDAVRTKLGASEATAYAIADNRTAELAEWDIPALAEQLKGLDEEDFDLAAVGYDDAELEYMLAVLEGEPIVSPEGEWSGMPEFQHEDQTSKFKAYVHFRSEEDVADFERIIGQKIPRDRWAIWHPRAEIGHYKDQSYGIDGSDAASLSGLHSEQGPI